MKLGIFGKGKPSSKDDSKEKPKAAQDNELAVPGTSAKDIADQLSSPSQPTSSSVVLTGFDLREEVERRESQAKSLYNRCDSLVEDKDLFPTYAQEIEIDTETRVYIDISKVVGEFVIKHGNDSLRVHYLVQGAISTDPIIEVEYNGKPILETEMRYNFNTRRDVSTKWFRSNPQAETLLNKLIEFKDKKKVEKKENDERARKEKQREDELKEEERLRNVYGI